MRSPATGRRRIGEVRRSSPPSLASRSAPSERMHAQSSLRVNVRTSTRSLPAEERQLSLDSWPVVVRLRAPGSQPASVRASAWLRVAAHDAMRPHPFAREPSDGPPAAPAPRRPNLPQPEVSDAGRTRSQAVLATNPITPENEAGHRGAARIKRRAGSHGGVQRAQGLRQRVPRSPGDVEWAAGARELGAGVRRCRNARTR